MQKYLRIFVWVVIILVVASCNAPNTPDTLPELFFPQQKEEPNIYMDADLMGQLILVDGCLRLDGGNANNFLLIWPKGFSVASGSNVVQVVDGDGQFVAQEGDTLFVSGGEIPNPTQYLAQPLPVNCSGPFWIVGNEIRQSD